MRIFYLLFIAGILSSCGGKNKVPPDVLKQKDMKLVMWDMIKADEFVRNFVTRDSSKNKKEESIKLYEEIFALHKTDKKTFDKSLHFYQSHPDLYMGIIDSLNSMQKQVQDEIYKSEPPKSKPSPPVDSLRLRSKRDSLRALPKKLIREV
ncbi:MAG: DUF4296 domain-containing protein [Bacteroidetes bacterium]|nr:DUF4296 domain-containing protein [Bacteroidota bacterium]